MANAERQSGRSPGRPSRLLVFAAVLAFVAFLAGGTLVLRAFSEGDGGPPVPPASAARPSAAPAGGSAGTPAVQPAVRPDTAQPPVVPLPPSPPTRVVIPKIAVDAPFVALGLEASGELAVPDPNNRNLAGWYKDAATPGAVGTAVVVAHVDTKSGPAAFYGLGALRPGDTADIVRSDGMVATFRIESVEVFDKKNFPADRVYADTSEAQLRLITCGGTFKKGAEGGYEANVVVFAKLVSTRRA
ncbi:class F sortase [Streptodolium elevatio]